MFGSGLDLIELVWQVDSERWDAVLCERHTLMLTVV